MKWRQTEKVARISVQAFMFQWRWQQRYARRNPEKAALIEAERILSS